MDASVLDSYRWNLIFDLLSLDGMTPFYEEMGLQIHDKQRFAHLLRRLITESRQTYEPGHTPDISFAEKVLKEIEANFGKATAEHFYKWATMIFCWVYQDQPHWSAWDHDTLPRHPAQLPDWLPPEKWQAIAEFREAHSIDDIEERVKALRSQPLSNWDAEMYSIHNYSNVEDPMCEDDFVDPYSPILSTIEMNRFQLAWPKLWSHFSEDEKSRFWEYAKQRRREIGLDKYYGNSVPHPDQLRRQI